MCNSKECRYKVYVYEMSNEYYILSSYLILYKDKIEVLEISNNRKADYSMAFYHNAYTSDAVKKWIERIKRVKI